MSTSERDTSEAGGEHFKPLEMLSELKRRMEGSAPDPLPERLPTSAIETMPALFQPRQIDEQHLGKLRRAVGVHGELEPILILQAGSSPIVIDGHHRLEAYRWAGVEEPVPVRYFYGSLEEAILEGGQANSKDKLPMTTQQRMDYAWRLVLLDHYSYSQMVNASGVSKSQLANMRKVLRRLGREATQYERWWQAKGAADGNAMSGWQQDDIETWKDAQADNYAERLGKHFGTKLANNPEIAAMALVRHFGRKLDELVRHLEPHVDRDDDDDLVEVPF
ncbi:MAG: ParB N-terminal domain-containing protein [Rhodospirillaceae bacterium]|nr:ParB N-terminal domain-containing protein [Rhodospirillaceae bacterium]